MSRNGNWQALLIPGLLGGMLFTVSTLSIFTEPSATQMYGEMRAIVNERCYDAGDNPNEYQAHRKEVFDRFAHVYDSVTAREKSFGNSIWTKRSVGTIRAQEAAMKAATNRLDEIHPIIEQ